MWDAEAAVDAESPWLKLWHIPDFDLACDAAGRVDWSAVRVMVSLLCECSQGSLTPVWQFAEGGDVDQEWVGRSLAAPLNGAGLGSGEDWAGVEGEWYAVTQPFVPWCVPLSELGMWSVSRCTLTETLEGFESFTGRPPTPEEAAALDPTSPFSPARPETYFSGRNISGMPHNDDPPAEVYIRGVVRLSTDNLPAAVWTWVVECGPVPVVARVVQMPGRGSAFFGRWKKEEDPDGDEDDHVEVEGAMWLMRA